jgi:hypothetical protein
MTVTTEILKESVLFVVGMVRLTLTIVRNALSWVKTGMDVLVLQMLGQQKRICSMNVKNMVLKKDKGRENLLVLVLVSLGDRSCVRQFQKKLILLLYIQNNSGHKRFRTKFIWVLNKYGVVSLF